MKPFFAPPHRSATRTCRAALAVWMLVLAGASVARAQAPAWTVSPAAFEQNMSVVASVSVSGVRLSSASDRLAAFVGSEVRGVSAPTVVGGANVFFLPVYANAAGETVTFKAYDAAANVVRDLAQSLSFAGNAVQGSATAPFALTSGTPTGGGGTGGGAPDAWRVNPADYAKTMSIVGVLRYGDGSEAGVTDRVAAFVGTQVRGVATPVMVDGRRVFFLPVYANAEGETLTFKVASGTTVRDVAGTLSFATEVVVGTPLAPHVWTVAGSGGAAGGSDNPATWNVTPASFDRSMNVVAALFTGGARSTDASDRLAAFVGSEVRGVAAPQLVGGAWLAFLTVYGRTEGEAVTFKVLDASSGQVLAVAEGQTFSTNAVVGTVAEPQAFTARGASSAAEDPRTWSVTPSAFEQTMNTVGQARVGTTPINGTASRVAAFVNGQVRGVSGPTTTGGQPLFFLTVYGRAGDGGVSYKAFDASKGHVYDVVQASPFEANRVEGQVAAPFALSAASDPVSLFVYPGDGNGDGLVNQSDLFPLSFYFGLAGPARAGASAQFRAELARAWAPVAASLADMNGDGRVNQNDLFALGLNFGRIRPTNGFSAPGAAYGAAYGAPGISRSMGGSAGTLRAVVPATDLRVGDTLRVSVRIAGAGSVRAAGFQLTYDAAAFEPLGRLGGALFAAALQNSNAFDLTKQEPGRVSYAVTSIGSGAGLSDGEVVVLRFRAKPGASGTAAFTLAAAEAMDASGASLALTPEPFSIRIASARTTHALPLSPGWSLVSSNVVPDAPALSNVTAGAGSVVLVKDLLGRVYWPELGITTLSSWERGAAYLVFSRAAGSLALTGTQVAPEAVSLALPAGWNLVGYLRAGTMATATALASLGDAVVIAKDLGGRVYWPAFGITSLASLSPGEGLYVYLSRAATLTYPANGTSSGNVIADAPLAVPPAAHYRPTTRQVPGGGTLLVRTQGWPDGTEVAAFAGARGLVGSGIVAAGQALVPVQAADPQTPQETEGAVAGDVLTLAVWDGRAEQPLALARVRDGLTGERADLRFQAGMVRVAEATAGPDQTHKGVSVVLDGPYPNPSRGAVHFTLALETPQPVRVAVYDLTGRAVLRLHEGQLASGTAHPFHFDSAALPSGVYFLRIDGAHSTVTRKLAVMR